MANARARLSWSQTSTAVARVLNAFRTRGSTLSDDWLVPASLRLNQVEEPADPVLLPVDVLIDVFCKKPG